MSVRHRLTSIALALTGAAAVAVSAAQPAAALEPGEMLVYRAGEPVPQSQLVDLGPPEGLGGTVLEGDPRISARIDHAEGDLLAGVFEATRGTVLVHFPFTEHATIIDGQVRLTDPAGNRAVLGPGDSYIIREGTDILWEVRGPRVQKSFFNRTTGVETSAPMIVHRAEEQVPQDQLTDLGDPSDLGGTVLEGDPRISARVDLADGPVLGGIFQATRGDVLVDFPFTEHATVTTHAVTLTDERGHRATLEPGDSYLIGQGTDIVWQVGASRVQKSFFNVTR